MSHPRVLLVGDDERLRLSGSRDAVVQGSCRLEGYSSWLARYQGITSSEESLNFAAAV